MKKTGLLIVLVSVIAILSVTVSGSFAKGKSKSVVIKWADVGPPKGVRAEYLQKAAKEVAKVTEGRVKIKFFWSQSLLKVKDVPAGLKDGFCDAGWIGAVYHPANIPLMGCINTMLFLPKGDDAYWLCQKGWEMYDKLPALHKELEKLNVKIWFIFVYPAYPMFGNVKVAKIEDMKGKVFRVSGESYVKMVEAIGARGEMIPSSETYSAIDKGIVDGAICGIDWGKSYSLYEVSKYLNLLNVFSIIAQGPVSIKKLDMMTDADRKAFMEVGRKYSLLYAKALNAERGKSLKFLKDAGLEIVKFPESERIKWAKLPRIQALPKQWVETQEKAGRPGKEVMKMAIDIMGVSDIISLH